MYLAHHELESIFIIIVVVRVVCLFVRLFIGLFAWSSNCPCMHAPIYSRMHAIDVLTHALLHPSTASSIHSSLRLFDTLFVRPFICLSIHLASNA